MISGVRGRIEAKLPGVVLVDMHGLILQVLTSQTTVNDIGEPGDPVELVTKLWVREDQITLYGFGGREELQLFDLLLTVTGIGPRVALSMLSTFRPEDLHNAIASEDVTALTRVPGLGRKTASRLILELRGKLPEPEASLGTIATSTDAEAIEALQALGYTFSEARDALEHVEHHPGEPVEARVFNALQLLARN